MKLSNQTGFYIPERGNLNHVKSRNYNLRIQVINPILLALSKAGVRHISTRSIGCNHINVKYAKSLGISVENVTYSPYSVAGYTLMLMLMVVRNAKSIINRADIHDLRLNDVRGKELRNMTIGVIGTGRIGTEVIDRVV
jgi:D-specific alpha-keto acid dehydrogenase